MKKYVNQYVDGCDTCQRNKPHTRKPVGLLKPLPVPTGPWQSVSYDLIVKLPQTQKGHDSVLVYLDRQGKEGHFIATKEEGLSDEKMVELYIHNIWKLHGTPLETISDRGTQLKTDLMRNLYKGLGIKMNLSTAFHPQTDGQTENVNNSGVEGFLRMFCNHRQDDWDDYLPFAEFAYNNAVHSSTGFSPFFAARGYNPTFTTMPSDAQANPDAQKRLEVIKSVQEEIQAAMTIAQEHQKRFYDRHHQDSPEYEVGQQVWLEATNIKTDRPSKKLSAKRLGPYEVLQKVGTHAYKLKLPRETKIHPVFHVSLLSPHIEDAIPGRTQPPPPPVVIEGELEYEVDKIINSRYIRGDLEYRVKWTNYSDKYNSWEPWQNVEHAPDKILKYHQDHPDADGPEVRKPAEPAKASGSKPTKRRRRRP